MTEKVKFRIPIDEIWNKFQEHLEIEYNNRILFSWEYWVWKTYFLNEFFNSKKEEYEVFHLFPINYQISSNNDIIKFLKYDILVELFKKDKEKDLKLFETTELTSFLDYSILTYLFFIDKENALKSIKTWIEFIPELGRPINETIWIFEKLFWFKKQIESWGKWIVDNFLKEIKDKKITENDLISELIKNKINELKWNKKSILVLDDLDRIDPEHIFRLLNIFWAHYDNENNNLPNKFWFDKIILVCDYENIKSIFHHKYWYKADFNWYIDKFFSIEKFNFDNSIIIEWIVSSIIKNIKIWNIDLKSAMDELGYINLLLEIILKQSSTLNWKYKLNLRSLLKWTEYQLTSLTYKINSFGSQTIELTKIAIKSLISIFWNDKNYLIETITKIKEKNLIKKYKIQKEDLYNHFSFYIYSDIFWLENIEDTDLNTFKEYSFNIIIKNKKIVLINDKKYSIDSFFYDLLKYYIERDF